MNGLDEALLVADEKGIVRRINGAFGELFGVDGKSAPGMSRRDTLEPFVRHFRDPEILAKDLLWLYDHPGEEMRSTRELADGRGLVRCYSRPVRDDEGRIIGRIESYRKVDEDEIRLCGVEKESIDAVPVGLIVVGDGLEIIWYNRRGGEIIADVLGFDPREMRSLDAPGHDAPLVRAVIDSLGNGRAEKRYGMEIGGRYFDLIVTPLSPGSRVRGAVVALIDAGQQHEAMARNERLRQEAEFYMDLLSHDIRNFNQVSMGYMEMLQIDENLTADERMYLAKALGGVTGSNKLIEDIRKVRTIRESGGKDIVPMDLGEIISEDVRQAMKSHESQRIIVNENAGSGRMVMANGLVHDVFLHILGNAIRYDEHPEKVIDIDVVESSYEGDDCWTVRIADHGPGIPDARKKAVFERMSAGSTRGAGLGLSIVRLIVDNLGGRIRAEDRVPGDPAQGSVFVVQLRKA